MSTDSHRGSCFQIMRRLVQDVARLKCDDASLPSTTACLKMHTFATRRSCPILTTSNRPGKPVAYGQYAASAI